MVDLYYRTIKAADYLLNGNPDVTDERILQSSGTIGGYSSLVYGIEEFDKKERDFFAQLV